MTNKIKILLLVTLFYTSCNSSKYPKSLVEIDSLCYSNPQLALTKLEQIGNNFDPALPKIPKTILSQDIFQRKVHYIIAKDLQPCARPV